MSDRLTPELRSQLTDYLKVKVTEDCHMSLGIFPMAIKGGDNPYEKRSEFQEGWNAAVLDMSSSVMREIRKVDTFDQNLLLLILADIGSFDDGRFFLNMNDTFGYAESFGYEVKPEEYKEVARLVSEYGFWGAAYWVDKKEGMNGSSIPSHNEVIQFIKNRVEKKK